MMRRLIACGLLLVLCSALLSCASTPSSLPEVNISHQAAATAAEAERAALQAALVKVHDKHYEEAIEELQKAIDAPAFAELGDKRQHQAIYLAGVVALELKDYQRAAGFLKRSSTFESSGLEDWQARQHVAYELKDASDSALCLTTIAERWPTALAAYSDRYIFSVVGQTASFEDQEFRFRLIKALYEARWQPASGADPGALWMELSVFLLERHDLEMATSVAGNVNNVYSLIAMRADKRFDDIIKAAPEHFDVIAASSVAIQRLQEASKNAPRKLSVQERLTSSLLTAKRYKEVLQITDGIIAQMAKGEAVQAYDDLDTSLNWIMDNRARALRRLGRWNDALEQLKRASEAPEHGVVNVSQSINLAASYADLGRPEEAINVLDKVGKSVSAYGLMQIEVIRLAAAVEMNRAVESAQSLAYLREHQSSAITTFQEGLVIAGEDDEAAALLISRLESPQQRIQTLLELQRYSGPLEPPPAARWTKRYRALATRADVKAAIERVGRIRSYNLDQGPK